MNKKTRKTIVPIAIGLIIGIIISGLYLSFKLILHNRIPQNTFVSGVDISLNTQQQALKKISHQTAKDLNTPIKLALDGVIKNTTPKELGLKAFSSQTIASITPMQAATVSLLDIFPKEQKIEIDIIKKLDEQKSKEAVISLFDLSAKLPTPATFALSKQKLVINDGSEGVKINYEKLKREILEGKREIDLEFTIGPNEINKEYLESKKEEVSQKLTHTFTLVDPVYTDGWTVNLIKNPTWVSFNGPELSLNKEAFNTYIDEELSKWLDRPVQEVKIFKNQEEKIVIDGEGHDGSIILRDILINSIESAIEHKSENVPIPIETLTPPISISKELQEMGIKERVSIGHTSYYGSPANRLHNIVVGAEKFNAKLIAPGETLSFNQTLGPVDGNTGYLKELVIKPEGTIPEYGGGICQVSTTMYRAALLAGIPIAERNQHSYAVSYYSQILGHGLDATIYIGGADLKMTNDAQSHLLVQSYVKNDYELYFIFYGTTTKTVELEGPYLSNNKKPGGTIYEESSELTAGQTKQVQKAHTGFDALWYRYVTDQNGETKKETIQTRYKAVPEKILVGQ